MINNDKNGYNNNGQLSNFVWATTCLLSKSRKGMSVAVLVQSLFFSDMLKGLMCRAFGLCRLPVASTTTILVQGICWSSCRVKPHAG
eukprot:scaffold541740_cov21-Prasinocladus_malaysianus.AAC.1